MGAVRYKSEFQSLAGRKYVVNIWDDEWEGSTGEFCLGPEGFELSYEGSTDDMYKPFVPSRLEFKFNVEDSNAEAFIIDLAQSEPAKFRIFITDSPASGDGNETLFWQGFVQGEGVSITDEYYPYEVNLSAGDIGFFKDIDYVPATGESTIVDTLIAILEQTDHAAFVTDGAHAYDEMLVTTMNWWGVNMASGGDPSDKVGINERAWTDYDKANAPLFANCQDVVESICKLFGCRFFQANGKFYLQQIDAISDGSTREWLYDLNKTLISDNFETKTIEVDRVDLFQMAGGSTTFAPGLKSVEREHKFTRNYLAGKTANQDAPLDLTIGAIPIFNYTVVGVVPYYQLKFKVTYRNIGNPAIFDPTKLFMPVWRMRFYGEGVTSGETWNYKRDILQAAEAYATSQDEYQFWQQLRFYTIEYKGWVTNTASGNPAYEPERYWIDITHPASPSVVQTPNGPEVSFTFDAIIPKFGDPTGAGESAENLYIKFDMYGIYGVDGNNNYVPVYLNNDTDPGTDWGQYFQWRIEEMELYMLPTYSGFANIDEPQANPITAKKYKVESPTNFRKKTEADDCKLIAFDRRTLNAVLTWNGTQFTDSQQWNRGAFNISGARSLNYLSIQEILAHNRIGMRMYQGAVVKKNDMRFGYDAVIEKNSIKYLPLQAAYNAVQDEWRNLTMIELDRDDSGLVYSEVVAEGAGTGGAGTGTGVSGGTWVIQPTASGGELIEYLLPNYEFASGQNGSTYTLNDIDLAALSGAPDSLVNRSLMVFQDATKLNYPLGYTVDWATSEITFTYELEDATIEVYYYG